MVISEDKMKNKKLTEANLVPYKKEQTEAVIKKIQKGVYGESLKEDFTKEAKEVLDKLEAEGWTTLSNLVRDGDRYFYILRKLQRDENGNPVKVIWKAVDEKTGEELDISYNQAIEREPIVGDKKVNELSKKLGKALLPHTESIDESMDDVWKDYESIEKFLEKNNYTNYDLMDYNEYPMSTSKISIRVDGDWKHDHLYFQDIIEEWAKENNRDIFKIDKDVEPSDSDWYAATYHIYVTKDKDSLDKLNSMRRLFASESLDESLLQDLQDDFSMARKNWDKLGLGIDFDSALEKWNDESELSEKETFYSKPIYSEDAWEDMVSMFSKNESLKEGDSRTIYSVEPRQSKSGLWEIVQVDTGNLAHTKRFYDKESCEKFIRRNARYNNWFVMYNKDFRKDLETKEPTEFGKVLQKQLGESLQSTNTKINIRESLNKIDWDTDNKYDLRNMYDASKMEYKDKIELAKMISLNESYENLYSCLKKFI